MAFSLKGSLWFTAMFLFALIGPWFALFVYSWRQVTPLSIQNSNIIFMGCTLTIVLMVIKSLQFFNANEKKAFIFFAVATTIALFSFLAALFQLILFK